MIIVKLQALRHEFEMLQMKSNESVQNFFTKVVGIVNQMRTYGGKIVDQTVVEKVLRSLPSRFDHIRSN